MTALLSSGNNLFFYAILGTVLGIITFFTGFKTWNKFKKIADMSTSKTRSMAAGLVELNGTAVPIKPVISPVSGKPCVYYRVEHQSYVRSKHGGSWVTTTVDTGFEKFLLKDDAGKVEVDPENADVDIPSDNIKYYRLHSKRDIEYYLAPGDNVFVLGTAKIKPGVKSAKNEENFLISKGEGDPFYYISDKKETDVQKHLSTSAKWQVYGGGIIFILSIGYIILTLAT